MPDRDDPLDTWTFALTEDGDLNYTEMNTLGTTTGHRAIVQDLKIALGTVKGEDPIDEEFGLDVFEATRSVGHLRREVRRTLLYDDHRFERVTSVPNIDIYRRGGSREAVVIARVTLEDGEETTLQLSLGGI